MKISDYINAEIEKAEQDDDVHVPDVLRGIADKVTQQYGHKCAFEYVGGFDSPGYDIDHYAFAYVEDGEVAITSYSYESY